MICDLVYSSPPVPLRDKHFIPHFLVFLVDVSSQGSNLIPCAMIFPDVPEKLKHFEFLL